MGGEPLKLLLDTHIWIWSQIAPDKLTKRIRRSLGGAANEVWLSSISVWELMLLVEKRRIVLNCSVEEWVTRAVKPLKEAPLTTEVVLEAGRFSLSHPDPADRFLVATARSLGLTLVTADRRLLASKAVSLLPNE
ncbi:MAG: type II toxin-antitoxin system VapC family toxin [Terriglobia bacterium]